MDELTCMHFEFISEFLVLSICNYRESSMTNASALVHKTGGEGLGARRLGRGITIGRVSGTV